MLVHIHRLDFDVKHVFQKPRFESLLRYMFFTSIKVASSWRWPLQVALVGVLTILILLCTGPHSCTACLIVPYQVNIYEF